MANEEIFKSYDSAVHSDFLIHWTGKDIDAEHQPDWYRSHQSKTDKKVDALYLKRLGDILKFGLWMTEEGERLFKVGSEHITIPPTPQCCFTELKLSESRRHAVRYGRLGIGVKRPFLFKRFGRPLAYFGFGERSQNDKFLQACATNLQQKELLNFFKPMNSSKDLNYDLYSESEWRILLFSELLKSGLIIDPRDPQNSKEHTYFNSLEQSQQEKLRYLIPLDGWFAMIIYPSLMVKNRAQWDNNFKIRSEITRIKSVVSDHGNKVEGLKDLQRGSWPIEVTLDSCRNF